ncbi:hypothetical protein BC941DRAFT_454865 [Chlamydoabsidia padenii]|nr:hypothetical protein BC941DRAFT_454865 [Chlamydoabsidia padenii]
MFMGTLWFVFMHYGGAFFPDCCVCCFAISLCFWYVKFPTFATEAQQWMARYESMAEFFGYTPVEMVEELQAVLECQAFSWYTRLEHTIKKDWVALKAKYLHKYNEDLNHFMAAVDKIKSIKQ